jgi:catechol 2,3-dioxygenase
VTLQVQQLGHVVLKVSDRARAERFYRDLLGLRVVATLDTPPMTFFTLGNHHDFAIVEVGDGPPAEANSPGLFHVAFCLGDSTADLRAAKASLVQAGAPILGTADHTVAHSIYTSDPDGNTIELYADVSDIWRTDPRAVASMRPLQLF